MNNPACPTFDCLCGNNPLSGYLSEATDTFPRLATAYVELEPPFGTEYCDRGCVAFASEVLPPPGTGLGPITQQFFSTPQQCTVFCPDGTPFVFEVNPGAFTGSTQAAADAAAMAYACQQANARLICLGPINPAVFLVGQPYNGSITASGQGLGPTNTWEIISGTLPPGLTFNGGSIAGNTATITGTPTTEGTYTFELQVTDSSGNSATRIYTMGLVSVGPTVGNTLDGFYVYDSVLISGCQRIQNGPFTTYTPAGPYIAGNEAINANSPWGSAHFQCLDLQFESAVPTTWHYLFQGTGCWAHVNDPNNTHTQMWLNFLCADSPPPQGTPQNPVVDNSGNFSQTGSFTTDAGNSVIVRIGYLPVLNPNSLQLAYYFTQP